MESIDSQRKINDDKQYRPNGRFCPFFIVTIYKDNLSEDSYEVRDGTCRGAYEKIMYNPTNIRGKFCDNESAACFLLIAAKQGKHCSTTKNVGNSVQFNL